MARHRANHIDDPVKVGERLRQARLAAGLKQSDLAFVDCSSAYVSRIESGLRTPSLQVLRHFAETLSISLDWLAKGTGPMKATTVGPMWQVMKQLWVPVRGVKLWIELTLFVEGEKLRFGEEFKSLVTSLDHLWSEITEAEAARTVSRVASVTFDAATSFGGELPDCRLEAVITATAGSQQEAEALAAFTADIIAGPMLADFCGRVGGEIWQDRFRIEERAAA